MVEVYGYHFVRLCYWGLGKEYNLLISSLILQYTQHSFSQGEDPGLFRPSQNGLTFKLSMTKAPFPQAGQFPTYSHTPRT